jgi:hypothetical protein
VRLGRGNLLRETTGYGFGELPPVGRLFGTPLLFDEDLPPQYEVEQRVQHQRRQPRVVGRGDGEVGHDRSCDRSALNSPAFSSTSSSGPAMVRRARAGRSRRQGLLGGCLEAGRPAGRVDVDRHVAGGGLDLAAQPAFVAVDAVVEPAEPVALRPDPVEQPVQAVAAPNLALGGFGLLS